MGEKSQIKNSRYEVLTLGKMYFHVLQIPICIRLSTYVNIIFHVFINDESLLISLFKVPYGSVGQYGL